MKYDVAVTSNARTYQRADQMEVGDIATIDGSRTLVLAAYDRIICLDDPRVTWHKNADFGVTPLPPGTKVTLTVHS
jgi:hypothetical protein